MTKFWSALLVRSRGSRLVVSGEDRGDGPGRADDSVEHAQAPNGPAAYLAIYIGEPHDPASFDRYYRERHVPILRCLPNIRSIEVLKGAAGQEERVYQIVEMRFDSLDDLNTAQKSGARAVAARDRTRVLEPCFKGEIFNQTVLIDTYNLVHDRYQRQ